jgi:hypothetical protein
MLVILFVIVKAYSVADTVLPNMFVIGEPPASGVNVNKMPTIFDCVCFQIEIELKL